MKLKLFYSKKEKDFLAKNDNLTKGNWDINLLFYWFLGNPTEKSYSLAEELQNRGYDLSTLRFEISKTGSGFKWNGLTNFSSLETAKWNLERFSYKYSQDGEIHIFRRKLKDKLKQFEVKRSKYGSWWFYPIGDCKFCPAELDYIFQFIRELEKIDIKEAKNGKV